MKGLPWLLGGAALLGGILISSPAHAATPANVPRRRGRGGVVEVDLDERFRTAFDHVTRTEGGGRYDAVNANTDGHGLSWGVIQWAQNPGSLGRLLATMQPRDPARFERTFGPSWRELLAATKGKGVRPVAGANLWVEPWLGRFREAGRDPFWQQVQRDAAQAQYWPAAVDASKTLGLYTPRAMTLFYDVSVNQGPGMARDHARTVAAAVSAGTVAPTGALEAYARVSAERFRRTAAPTINPERWREVSPGVWHRVAGKFDLFRSVTNRGVRILRDSRLSDTLA